MAGRAAFWTLCFCAMLAEATLEQDWWDEMMQATKEQVEDIWLEYSAPYVESQDMDDVAWIDSVRADARQKRGLLGYDNTETLNMLDALQRLMTGIEGDTFDRKFYSKILVCMKVMDSRLPDSHEGIWKGWVDHWKGNSDEWGKSDPFFENNITTLDYLDMRIYEPCNTMSSTSFYHALEDYCVRTLKSQEFNMPDIYLRSIGKALAQMGPTSAFYHCSNSNVGGQEDVAGIRIFAYLVYQGMTSILPTDSSVVKELSSSSRSLTALEMQEEFLKMHLNLPVTEWLSRIESLKLLDYLVTFTGIVSFYLSIVSPTLANTLVPILVDLFGLPDELRTFIEESHLPEVRAVLEPIDIPVSDRLRIFKKSLTPIIKLVYAFIWQEQAFPFGDVIYTTPVNAGGFAKMPAVHKTANKFAKFKYYNLPLQAALGVYPGEKRCGETNPHSKWHVGSAAGVLDLFYLADEIYGVLERNLAK